MPHMVIEITNIYGNNQWKIKRENKKFIINFDGRMKYLINR